MRGIETLHIHGGISVHAEYLDEFTLLSDPRHDGSHIHDFYEIYVNLSGNVSFLVESSIYPISHGDIVITAPNEIHKCLYHTDTDHKHFCIWFYTDKNLFSNSFHTRPKGNANLISLPDEEKEAFIAECSALTRLYNAKAYGIEFYAALFRIFTYIDIDSQKSTDSSPIPPRFYDILSYIDANFTAKITVGDICTKFSVSRSTVSRYFSKTLHTTFFSYLTSKRLALAKEMLRDGKDVLNTCYDCGFPDYSHFIAVFRNHFGTTPYKYAIRLSRRQ